jgi:hypothetical protein
MVHPFITALPVAAATSIGSLVKKHPSILGYVIVSTVYEGARTLPRVKNAKWHARSFRDGYKGPDVPLLNTEKFAASTFCSLQGIIAAPVHLVEDVKRLEMKARGLDPLMYGYTPNEMRGENTYMSYWDIVTDNPHVPPPHYPFPRFDD